MSSWATVARRACAVVGRRGRRARGNRVHGGVGRVLRLGSLSSGRSIDSRRVSDCSRLGLDSVGRVGVDNRHTLCRVSSSSGMSWLGWLSGVAGVARVSGLARFTRLARVSGACGVVVRLCCRLGNGMGVDGCESVDSAAGLARVTQLGRKGVRRAGVIDDTLETQVSNCNIL
jgi:hypothetical protein